MEVWGVIVLLAVVAGAQVFAEDLVFPEDVQSQSSSRIVSGWEAREGQIPWQLSLRMVNGSGSVSSCGGSIVHPEWGITAAHCTATRYTMVLRAGAVNLWRPELLFETTEYYNHPLYINELVTVVQPHDISLLKFPRAITFSARVQPIRIQRDADRNRNYAGVRLEASGWGRTWTEGPSPENLQWVYLRGVTNLACWFAYGGSSTVVDSTICASYYNVTSQSTCQGDSGGPLVDLEEDGKYTMVGVSSFVARAGCHVADFPAGFIRPGHYHDWYRQVTGINFDWEHGEPPSESSSSESSSSEETVESSEEVTPEPETEESEEAAPEPETEESEEVTPEPDTEEEIAPEPESEESEEAAPEPETEEEIAPEPETEEISEEVAPEPETEESEEVVPQPEPEESDEAAPEPETEEEVAPEPETEESEEVVPQPESEESEEAAPEPETEEEIAPETEESEEVAPEPETEEEVAPEPETEEVAPEAESEEASAQPSSEDENKIPEETRFGFPAFAKFLIQ